MRVVLEVTEGPGEGKVYEFDSHNVFLVGRSQRCHFCVGPDKKASRVHLMVEVSPTICRVRDLGSQNGVYVNEVKVPEAELQNGDIIRVGRSTLSVSIARTPPSAGDETICVEFGAEDSDGAESVPGYRLATAMRSGGMGTLWLAEDLADGRQVVIKTIRPDKLVSHAARQLFLRETKISIGLHHPNIVRFLETGEHKGRVYIVMEYVSGKDADALRKSHGGTLPAEDVIEIGLQALAGLEYAHSRNIVHRDIKPANILVEGDSPSNYVVKLTDFGLAKSFREHGFENITQTGVIRGSVQFMPPEQVTDCRGADHRADIFSLGATLYNLLTGTYVWPFSDREDPFLTIVQQDPVPIESRGVSVPGPLADVIDHALRKSLSQRYQSALEMRNALQAAR
jgi:eukaryotic-like serine/threonine-protein kinase